jgi:bifunctional DNase/RNase
LLNILESLNAKILEVSITDIHDKTYFAEIKLSTHEGELTLSSRPSDAIALALRSSAEIFVENSVFNDNFIEIYDENNVDIEEFSQFIDNVSPEDFS